MPRDPRPYLTYPVGYTQHPRWELLSDKAFRALHEMQDYCRQNRTDGRIDLRAAERRWPKKILDELVTGIDDRPLVVVDDSGYVIRSYAEHQMTEKDFEDLHEKRARAGRIGGRRSGIKRQALASGLLDHLPEQTLEQNEAETKTETVTTSNEVVRARSARSITKRGTRIPDDFTVTPEMVAWCRDECPAVDGRKQTDLFIDHWRAKPGKDGVKLDWVATWKNWMRRAQAFAEERGWKPEVEQRIPLRNVTAERLTAGGES